MTGHQRAPKSREGAGSAAKSLFLKDSTSKSLRIKDQSEKIVLTHDSNRLGGRGVGWLRSKQSKIICNRSPLKKMDNKQNHRSPQRQQQPSPQTSSGMRDDTDHPGNDGRTDRRERKQNRANLACGDSEALRK